MRDPDPLQGPCQAGSRTYVPGGASNGIDCVDVTVNVSAVKAFQ
jgi:hypothetical protein